MPGSRQRRLGAVYDRRSLSCGVKSGGRSRRHSRLAAQGVDRLEP